MIRKYDLEAAQTCVNFGVRKTFQEKNSYVLREMFVLTFQRLEVYLRTARFNIKKFNLLLALCRVFCRDLSTNANFCFVRHKRFGFYNRDEKCLQRGTDWVFIYRQF